MTLSVAIAAHPNRSELVTQLKEELACPEELLNTIWDEKDDIWDTHDRAWKAVAEGATHHLVLQDDAKVCLNLLPALREAVQIAPNKPMALYFGNATTHPKIVKTAARADLIGASWIKASGTFWGVAILLPVPMIGDMLQFCTGRRETYDRRVAIWCEHHGHEVLYPWPSLVEHRDAPSLLYPGRRPGRHAFRYIDNDPKLKGDALNWDPAGPVVQCGRIAGRTVRLGTRKGG